MPRGNRHFLPRQVWHITHRCHQQAFLLKFARDRQHYLRWLFEVKKRFWALCTQLHGHLEPHSPVGKRYRPGRDLAKHGFQAEDSSNA